MPTEKQALPSAITLPIPMKYRRYLLCRLIQVVLGGVILGLGMLFAFYVTGHQLPKLDASTAFIFLPLLAAVIPSDISIWSQSRRFTINRKFMTVILCRGSIWRWQRLIWFTDAVVSVERCEWRGLPALSILIEGKRRKTAMIVFCEEDRATVETQIIPLIETYRHRHRNEALADLLQLQ